MTTINQLNEYNRFISDTRQPFVRRHNSSCVYYGIRGNARSQYLWDKSCILDGAGLAGVEIERTGVVWNGGLGEEVINPVGVLWNGGIGMNQGSMTLLGMDGVEQDRAIIQQAQDQLNASVGKATVVIAKTSTSGAGEIDGQRYVMLSADMWTALNQILSGTPGGAPVPKPMTGTLAEFLVDGAAQIGTVSEVLKILALADNNIVRRRDGQPMVQPGMPTKTKVLLGVGALAVVGTVAAIALTRPHTSLNGARPRRRRRRKS